MSVNMKPTSVIKARLGINPGGKAQKKLATICQIYMDKYVPEGDTTLLRNNVDVGKNYVLYKSEYAQYLYYGMLMVDPDTGSSYAKKDAKKVLTSTELKYHTAGTGSHWDKKMMSAEGSKVVKELQTYIDRGCK